METAMETEIYGVIAPENDADDVHTVKDVFVHVSLTRLELGDFDGGADTLAGYSAMAGADQLWGGGGRDSFVFKSLSNKSSGGNTADFSGRGGDDVLGGGRDDALIGSSSPTDVFIA